MIVSVNSVLLCYLDESYTSDHYYIATMICPDHQALSLDTELDDVVNRAATDYSGIKPTAELHGHDIFQGKQDWEPLKTMVRARIGVYSHALAAIANHQVALVIEGIHPTSRMRVSDPHSLLMRWTLERIDEYACKHDDLALVIADEPGQYTQQREYRADLGSYRTSGTGGWRSRKITRVVDTLHFAPSHSSRLVQASDLVAFFYNRINTKQDTDHRAQRANNQLWKQLHPVVESTHVWTPGH